MKADITRQTFRPAQHYIATVQQQGRVPLDADWNEQTEIQQHHDEIEITDVVGAAGVPKGSSFLVDVTADGKDLRLGAGRAYVGGLVCENGAGTVATMITSANQITPLTWTLDGVPLRLGEWIEIASTSSDARAYRIIARDPATLRLTLANGADNLVTRYGGVNKHPRISRVVTYTVQPELWRPEGTSFPAEPALPSFAPQQTGLYLAYLDVWKRHVTALEDPKIREVALGGPDTCTRVRVTWQLKLDRVGSSTTCATAALPAQPSTGALSARAVKPGDAASPCVIPPTARYRSLDNQLYRVEIHQGGPLGAATFKYSIDNGTVVTAWVAQSSSTSLVVTSTGKDSVLRFVGGQWVELIDDARELAGEPGLLVKIDTVSGSTINVATPVDLAQFPLNPRIRRWDQASASGALVVEQAVANDGYLVLDDSGVEVKFEPGTYTTGDYWLIPARTITADVDWPRSELGTPLPMPREGIEHHFAKLGLVSWDGTKFEVVDDCRLQFPPLTDIHASDVIMDPGPCLFPDNVKTVQDAISELCQQKENACCELVIVPGDDVKSAIDDALERNLARGIRGLHVCFAAGTHVLPATLVVTAPNAGGDITLSGCGLASHVTTTAGTAIRLVGWTSATLSDLNLVSGSPPASSSGMSSGGVSAGSGIGSGIGSNTEVGVGPAGPGAGISQVNQPVYGAIVMANCKSGVVERATIKCGSASTRRTACVVISSTATKAEARVTDCDLKVGNRQAGVMIVGIDRSTVEGNRIDVVAASASELGAMQRSPGYISYLRSQLMSDLRLGNTASRNVMTRQGTLRNHVTVNNLKIAFTSDAAAAAVWSSYFANGGFSRIASLQHTETLVNAIVREKQRTPVTTRPTTPAPAVPTAIDAQARISMGNLPNNLAARVRTSVRNAASKIVNLVVSKSQAELQQMGLGGFGQWRAQQDAQVQAVMNAGIMVVGTRANDVRVLDNAISGALSGVRVAVSADPDAASSAAPRVTRARIAGNTMKLTPPSGQRGLQAGVFVGSCASVTIESNYIVHTSSATNSTGVYVSGVLGKMMRGEGNHTVKSATGIKIVPINPDPEEIKHNKLLWVLSQNVAEDADVPIAAPESVRRLHNAP